MKSHLVKKWSAEKKRRKQLWVECRKSTKVSLIVVNCCCQCLAKNYCHTILFCKGNMDEGQGCDSKGIF